ncbi:hypothetical protein KIL84_005540 [Mauremys mutica]|uniref:Uncharacterized protein n=1 Tax=Mauremys mutica TaxID=74926 RepID=A0A9D4AQR3_9SAUR|nr:hypothetical protein KIL84_005540 [Mauremys mutica]
MEKNSPIKFKGIVPPPLKSKAVCTSKGCLPMFPKCILKKDLILTLKSRGGRFTIYLLMEIMAGLLPILKVRRKFCSYPSLNIKMFPLCIKDSQILGTFLPI